MSKDYTDYDYESLVDRMTTLLAAQPGWGQGYASSTGQTLIELVADTTDALHYMLERRSQEAYTSTALLTSSIWAAASEAGYRPRRKVSPTGTLRLTLVDDAGATITTDGNINIPYGKKITFNGEEFAVAEDYILSAGGSTIDIKVIQGSLVSETHNFSTEPLATDKYIAFTDYKEMEEFSLKVVGDGVTYEDVFKSSNGLRVRALSYAAANQTLYDLKFARREMRVVFGDGIFGAAPTGDITFSWIKSKGSEVDVLAVGQAFKFDSDTLTDDVVVVPENEYLYTLTNTTPIRGGKEEEKVEEIRDNLRAFVRTNDRAVTNFDYEFWSLRSGIGDIVDVKAYGEHERDSLIFGMNNVYFTYATGDGLDLNATQVTDLRAYLDQVKVNLPHLVFRPAERINLGVVVDFRREPNLPISNSQLYRILRDKIRAYFAIDKDSIGRGVQHSEFVKHLQALQFEFNGVVYDLTDFVKVKLTGMVPFTIPLDVYDGVLELSNAYTPSSGDVWTVTVDGVDFIVVAVSTDTVATLVEKMKAAIFASTTLMLTTPQSNQLRIRHPATTGTFTVSVGGGDLSAVTTFSQWIQIPRNGGADAGANQILPGSVEIVDANGNTFMSDDGAGLLVDAGGTYADVEIDYVESRFEAPSIPAGSYYISYQQNSYQNFAVTREALITNMPIREGIDPVADYFFSRINLL